MVFRKMKRWRRVGLSCFCFGLLYFIFDKATKLNANPKSPLGHFVKEMKYEGSFVDALSRWASRNLGKKGNEEPCELETLVVDGLPWPKCENKMDWMRKNHLSSPCYKKHGVDDTPCSWYRYLSEVENHCPSQRARQLSEYGEDEMVQRRSSMDGLYQQLQGHGNYQWMKERIHDLEERWISEGEVVFGRSRRKRKRILIHLGLMQFDIGKIAWKGGPLGEMVQWSDLMASLHIMGHDITVTQSKDDIIELFKDTTEIFKTSCKGDDIFPFDLVFTDIYGLHRLKAYLKLPLYYEFECRFRVVDSFGTEALMNKNPYLARKKMKSSPWGGLGLNLKQFNTMFPHTPDNTFLGFVIESSNQTSVHRNQVRNTVLVYGKRGSYWKGKKDFIDIVHEYFPEIHATVHDGTSFVPSYVKIHEVLPINELVKLYKKSKIFLGLGFPFEGPAPLEAIANGAIFINPKFGSERADFFENKPTRRKITSQNPYAEDFIGEPHVYTIDINDTIHLRQTLRKIKTLPSPVPYLPLPFTFKGMLQRVNSQIGHQNFCQKSYFSLQNSNFSEWWPPLGSLQVLLSDTTDDCTKTCQKRNLICEPPYFSVINREASFEIMGAKCNATIQRHPNNSELDFPAFNEKTKECFLQTDQLLFSCAGRFTKNIRLCPCRDSLRGDSTFCKGCKNQPP